MILINLSKELSTW